MLDEYSCIASVVMDTEGVTIEDASGSSSLANPRLVMTGSWSEIVVASAVVEMKDFGVIVIVAMVSFAVFMVTVLRFFEDDWSVRSCSAFFALGTVVAKDLTDFIVISGTTACSIFSVGVEIDDDPAA